MRKNSWQLYKEIKKHHGPKDIEEQSNNAYSAKMEEYFNNLLNINSIANSINETYQRTEEKILSLTEIKKAIGQFKNKNTMA